MSAAFTPGPWLWQDRPGWRLLVIKEGRGAIVDLARGRLVGKDEEKEANARLIAAAPELYEALAETVAAIRGKGPRDGKLLARADAVLAKAVQS